MYEHPEQESARVLIALAACLTAELTIVELSRVDAGRIDLFARIVIERFPGHHHGHLSGRSPSGLLRAFASVYEVLKPDDESDRLHRSLVAIAAAASKPVELTSAELPKVNALGRILGESFAYHPSVLVTRPAPLSGSRLGRAGRSVQAAV